MENNGKYKPKNSHYKRWCLISSISYFKHHLLGKAIRSITSHLQHLHLLQHSTSAPPLKLPLPKRLQLRASTRGWPYGVRKWRSMEKSRGNMRKQLLKPMEQIWNISYKRKLQWDVCGKNLGTCGTTMEYNSSIYIYLWVYKSSRNGIFLWENLLSNDGF